MIGRTKIRTLVEANGATAVSEKFIESLQKGDLKPNDFSIKQLAEGFLGEDVVNAWQYSRGGLQTLEEAGEAVSIRGFSNTLGGIIMASMESGYRRPGLIGEALVSVVDTPNRFDRIGMPSEFDTLDFNVNEGAEIPTASFTERYIDTPDTTKKAMAVAVTREMVIADRGGQLMEQAATVGEYIAQLREQKILRGVLGIDNTYKENGNSLNTYLTSGAWINQASNELLDHSNIEAALVALANIDAPSGGLPLIGMPDTIVVPTAKALTANRLTTTPTIQVNTQSLAVETPMTNPYVSQFNGRVFSSPWIRRLLIASGISAANADKYWIIGDTRKAFQYRQNWALTNTAVGPNPLRDIVAQFIASERGVLAIREPRYVYRGTN